MLQMRKGCIVPFPEKLSEGYQHQSFGFIANVDADKIVHLLTHFIQLHQEPMFFILELPSKQDDETEIRPSVVNAFHKDVYYIDGCTKQEALVILNSTVELMLNDGLCSFGIGGHLSHDEIMVEKYNLIRVYTRNPGLFEGFFEEQGIGFTENLITAWDTFTQDAPGESFRVDTNGRSIYDLPELLRDFGIYLAERREA